MKLNVERAHRGVTGAARLKLVVWLFAPDRMGSSIDLGEKRIGASRRVMYPRDGFLINPCGRPLWRKSGRAAYDAAGGRR